MLIKKSMPGERELALIKINKILPHGAYCELIEYGMEAYLPISEIASGWIKNIHEFIKEGQKDVARVMVLDKEKKSIDISLKKVTAKEKKDKISEYNLEKRYEKLFDQALAAAKLSQKKEAIVQGAAKKVSTYTEIIQMAAEKKDLGGVINNTALEAALSDVAAKNIKPKRYEVSYTLEIRASDPKTNIKNIKNILEDIEKGGVEVLYLGAPHYQLTSEDSDYPKAESRIKEAQKILEKQKGISFTITSAKE